MLKRFDPLVPWLQRLGRGLVLLVCLGFAWPVSAWAAPLRVGVAGSAPFVIQQGEGGRPSGISVEVWREIAAAEQLGHELVVLPNVNALLGELAAGRLDVAVGPISITSARARTVAFTQPYFTTTMGILSPTTERSWFERLRPFLSRAFIIGLGVLVLVLASVGVLIWLAERRANESHFPRHPLRGVAEGMWFALVTMTTVGYGDRVPVTPLGRFLAGGWMVFAMISVSSITAGIATALTVSQLDRPGIATMESLRDHRIAVVQGTIGSELARAYTRRLVTAPDLDAAVDRLTADDADALVFDLPQLEHYLGMHPAARLRLADSHLAPQRYGFAVAIGSPLQRRLNLAILKTLESGRVETIRQRFLAGDDAAD